MNFEVLARCGAARRGHLVFRRGEVRTPAFMPVGTYGTVKSVTPEEVAAGGAEIILGNTFHLMLRPGTEVIHGPLNKRIRQTRFFLIGPDSPQKPVEDVSNNHGKEGHFPEISGFSLFNHARYHFF